MVSVLRSGVLGALVLGMLSAKLISLEISVFLVTSSYWFSLSFFIYWWNNTHSVSSCLRLMHGSIILYFPLMYLWADVEVSARSIRVPLQYVEQKHLWDESKGIRGFLRWFIHGIIFTAVGSQLWRNIPVLYPPKGFLHRQENNTYHCIPAPHKTFANWCSSWSEPQDLLVGVISVLILLTL